MSTDIDWRGSLEDPKDIKRWNIEKTSSRYKINIATLPLNTKWPLKGKKSTLKGICLLTESVWAVTVLVADTTVEGTGGEGKGRVGGYIYRIDLILGEGTNHIAWHRDSLVNAVGRGVKGFPTIHMANTNLRTDNYEMPGVGGDHRYLPSAPGHPGVTVMGDDEFPHALPRLTLVSPVDVPPTLFRLSQIAMGTQFYGEMFKQHNIEEQKVQTTRHFLYASPSFASIIDV
jgi:hypothetical protein